MSTIQPDDEARGLAAQLLNQLGAGPPVRLEPLSGGRNNRAFRVVGATDSWLMKQYFHDAQGGRDRCADEWAWTSFCRRQRVTSVPQPLAVIPDQHAALFEFVDGRRLERHEIEMAHVEQALAFVIEVNRHCIHPDAASLPEAAEACFSMRAHLDCVERRVQRLLARAPNDSLDEKFLGWSRSDLEPAWRQVSEHVEQQLAPKELSRQLADDERILSPSDCGFHNALLEPTGRLRFIDFEYAGWDDPAKLVCDFYWQQECPAPRETLPLWIAPLARDSSAQELERRVELLFPVYGVKWCCIVLNEFLAADRPRREFARLTIAMADRRGEQLDLARRLLADVCRRD